MLDRLLARLAAEGLVTAGGKQRTDSTHVVAAVAALTRLELAGESVRAALEALAVAHPGWLSQRVCVADFTRRYGTPMTAWRPPASAARREELAIAYARDGYALVQGGNGLGVGVAGVGGSTGGADVAGAGGAPNGIGVAGDGGPGDGVGVVGAGTGSREGVSGVGGPFNGTGVVGTGGDNGSAFGRLSEARVIRVRS